MSKYGLSRKQGRDVVVVNATFGLLALLSVFLRLWSRKIKQIAIYWDDYLIIASMVRLPKGKPCGCC
jgi:hypothetical protein